MTWTLKYTENSDLAIIKSNNYYYIAPVGTDPRHVRHHTSCSYDTLYGAKLAFSYQQLKNRKDSLPILLAGIGLVTLVLSPIIFPLYWMTWPIRRSKKIFRGTGWVIHEMLKWAVVALAALGDVMVYQRFRRNR